MKNSNPKSHWQQWEIGQGLGAGKSGSPQTTFIHLIFQIKIEFALKKYQM
jgi:hypothetical protein